MQKFASLPKDENSHRIPTASDASPLIVMQYPKANLDYLLLYHNNTRDQLDYTATTKGLLIEITPNSALNPGVYCLVQGDPNTDSSLWSSWCFRVR